MRSLLALADFDLRRALRRPTTWIYLLVYGGLGMLLMAVAGGAVGFVHLREQQVLADAPIAILRMGMGIGLFATVTISAVLGQAAHRDIACGIHPLLFAAPLSKTAYIGGRFLAGLLVMALVLAAIPLGLFAGTLLPGVQADRLGAGRFDAYLQVWLLLLPNLLWVGAVFFGLALFTRSMLANYLGGILLLVGYGVAANLANQPEWKTLAAIVDPFGGAALHRLTEYWTPAEQNVLVPSLSGILLLNRLLWGTIGLAIFALCAWRFRFAHAILERRGRRRPAAAAALPAAGPPPVVERAWGGLATVGQILATGRLSCRLILGNIYFPVILLVGLLFLWQSSSVVGRIYGTPTWPVTSAVLEVLRGAFHLFTLVVITIYAGELVWHERDRRMQPIADALPVPTWALLAGRLGGLLVVVVLLQGVVAVAGMLMQLAQGFTTVQPGLYLAVLFGLDLVAFLPLVVLAMAVQVVVNQKQLGMAVFLLLVLGISFLPSLGLEHPLWHFAELPGWIHSDLNSFGPFLGPWTAYAVHWCLVSAVILLACLALWVRGSDTSWRWRLRLARRRSAPRGVWAAALLAVLFSGGWIWWNTNIVVPWRTTEEQIVQRAEYERRYKSHQETPQPRIVAVQAHCELFPAQERVRWSGTQRLVNRTDQPVRELHVLLDESLPAEALVFTPSARLTTHDALGYRIYQLDEPLPPGAELTCAFDLTYRRRGFSPFTQVVGNGSFIAGAALPSYGYDPAHELADAVQRGRLGLPERQRLAPPDDPTARRNSYIAHDADWIDLELTVSTDADQIAIAPGTLQREWLADGRRHAAYRVATPALNFACVLSGRYAVQRAAWNGVALEILHHPAHAWNLAAMERGMRETLAYASAAFGPYQHDHLRIAEFPRYGQFAQSFPGSIAFSEGVGFIARLDDETRIDYPFYITAHEVAHQWWAHQVVGAQAQGATLLSEVLSQYTALMVMERAYGAAHMRRFLRYELDNYLIGRAVAKRAELPLVRVEPDQQHLHYNKGAVAMYALKEHLGEERLNAALRAFVTTWRQRGPPYPTSLDLLAAIKAEAPPALHGFVDDLLLHITLWDLKATTARAEALPDGTWRVELAWEARQLRADGTGTQQEVPLDLPIDLGVFAEAEDAPGDPTPLVLEQRRITAGAGSATFIVPQRPLRAGIDPYHKLIDRYSGDNVVPVQTP